MPKHRYHLMAVTIKGPATLVEAAATLGVAETSLDPEFGVIEVDPDKNLYSVMIEEGALNSEFLQGEQYSGPYSNPKIAPMAPIQKKKSQ